ncbi:acetylxylan esterase [Dactylosporangium sp. CS-033363]|uniref:acetylxylan esterase n=1 Tax=Dactylosporangium sp. CS-033363 TaxID=3239935 RepID=UPI003D8CE206
MAEPEDFDAFWAETLRAARANASIQKLSPHPTPLQLLETWDVTFGGFGGAPIRAWYTRPAGSEEDLPAVVEFVGYGRGRGLPIERLTWPTAGYAHLLMDARGQGDQYGNGGDTPDPHRGAPGGSRPTTDGILDPHDYYYRRLVTDAVRAVDAARALPGVDPARVAAAGNSQGGGLALAVAGLVPDLFALLTSAPFLCDIERALSMTELAPYGEIRQFLAVHRERHEQVLRTLSYVDGLHFARRAGAPAHFGVGGLDPVCPASTALAAFDAYAGSDKTLHVYPYNGHEGGEALHTLRQLEWLPKLSK